MASGGGRAAQMLQLGWQGSSQAQKGASLAGGSSGWLVQRGLWDQSWQQKDAAGKRVAGMFVQPSCCDAILNKSSVGWLVDSEEDSEWCVGRWCERAPARASDTSTTEHNAPGDQHRQNDGDFPHRAGVSAPGWRGVGGGRK